MHPTCESSLFLAKPWPRRKPRPGPSGHLPRPGPSSPPPRTAPVFGDKPSEQQILVRLSGGAAWPGCRVTSEVRGEWPGGTVGRPPSRKLQGGDDSWSLHKVLIAGAWRGPVQGQSSGRLHRAPRCPSRRACELNTGSA